MPGVVLPAERLNGILLLRQAFGIGAARRLPFSRGFFPSFAPGLSLFLPFTLPAAVGKDKRPTRGRVPSSASPGNFSSPCYACFPFCLFNSSVRLFSHSPLVLFIPSLCVLLTLTRTDRVTGYRYQDRQGVFDDFTACSLGTFCCRDLKLCSIISVI